MERKRTAMSTRRR